MDKCALNDETERQCCENSEETPLKLEDSETEVPKMKRSELILYRTAFAVNIISFTCGITFSWSSPVIPKLNGSIDPEDNPLPGFITPSEESWIASLLSLGAAIGPLVCGITADKIGRKMTLLLFAIPVVVSFLILAFANQIVYFYVARFIQGFGIASVFVVVPMYVGEIAENHNRGSLGVLMSVFLTLGLLFSYVVGPYVTVKVFSLICAVPPLIFIITSSVLVPESPYYFIAKKDQNGARESLKKIRNSDDIQKELMDITQTVESSFAQKSNISDFIKMRGLRKGLIIAIGLLFFQQTSGITVILAYMQSIFEATGSSISSDISTIVIGIAQFISCFVTSTVVDKLGRRILLLISITGMLLFQFSLGVYFFLKELHYNVDSIFWLPILSLIVYIITYNLGFSSLPWAIMGEVFPSNVKSTASTMCTCVCLTIAFTTSLCFPYLVAFIGIAKSFFLFASFCFLGLIFVVIVVPETKGKSLNEIQVMLNNNNKK